VSDGVEFRSVNAATATSPMLCAMAQSSTGDSWCVAIEPWARTQRRVRIGNAGVDGSTAEDWLQSVGLYGSIPCIQRVAAPMTVIGLMANDAFLSLAAATWSGYMQQLITATKVNGDVALMSPLPLQNATVNGFVGQYVAAMHQLAATNNIRIIDPWTKLGGVYTPALNSGDGVHPNLAGQQYMADEAAAVLLLQV
jgi:lysophospholipase L1-like esterase